MRRFLLFALLLVAFEAKSQQSVLFKVKYSPNHSYSSSFIVDNNTQMNIEADKEIIEKIKAKGIKLPMILTGNTEMDFNVKTGAIAENKTYPITISYTNIKTVQKINGEEKIGPQSPLVGLNIFGHYDESGKMHMDSIPGKNVNDTLRSMIFNMVKSFQDKIKFPDYPLKVGDTFSQELPMTLPIEGNSFNIVVKINYKLTDLKENNAFFDLEQTANFNFAKGNATMNMLGKGNGKMVFDIINGFSSNTTSNLKFDYTMRMGKILIKGSALMSSIHKTVIN